MGGLGTQYGEIPGSFLLRIRHDWGMRLRVASERSQRHHMPLLEVRACQKCGKVSDNDVPTRITTVRHIGGGDGLAIHGFRGVIPWTTTEMGSIPVKRNGIDRWVHYRTPEKGAQNRSGDRLEPASGQSGGTPTPGIWCQLPKRHYTVFLPLSQLPWFLLDLEWTM